MEETSQTVKSEITGPPMEFYRSSAAGAALIKSLNTMIESKEITEEFALKVLVFLIVDQGFVHLLIFSFKDNYDATFQSTLRDNLYIMKGHHTVNAKVSHFIRFVVIFSQFVFALFFNLLQGKLSSYNELRDLWKIDGEDVTLEMEGGAVDAEKTFKRARFLFTK